MKKKHWAMAAVLGAVSVIALGHRHIAHLIQNNIVTVNKQVDGCATVTINSKSLIMSLSGGKRVGVRIYGVIPTGIETDADRYVVYSELYGDGIIHLASLSDEMAMKFENLLKLTRTTLRTDNATDHFIPDVFEGFFAVKSIYPGDGDVVSYSIPQLRLSIDAENIMDLNGLISVEALPRCE